MSGIALMLKTDESHAGTGKDDLTNSPNRILEAGYGTGNILKREQIEKVSVSGKSAGPGGIHSSA